ncbi:MAG: hypothetical protein AB7P04_00895 [Bacteriovoracia bacterium]
MKTNKMISPSLAAILAFTQIGITTPISYAGAGTEKSPQEVLSQRDKNREALVRVRNQLSALDSTEWTKAFSQASELEDQAGNAKKSRVLKKLSNPKYQSVVVENLDKLAADDSTNVAAAVLGIASFLTFASSGYFHMESERAYYESDRINHRKIRDNLIYTSLIIGVLAVISLGISLEGEDAELI